MPKKETIFYVCSNCGFETSSWSGKCFNCGEWNSLEEKVLISSAKKSSKKLVVSKIKDNLNKDFKRLISGIDQIDAVMGGGIVPGSVILLAGQPGIGKSTVLLQLANAISKKNKVLYVSGEESVHQISLRAKRLKIDTDNIEVASSNSADQIAVNMSANDYQLVIVDSIQTVSCDNISSSAGSVSQITNSTYLLSSIAKQRNIAIILVGHVTKEGNIAGPKVLEHLVDVVVHVEGDRYGGFKILRPVKNRFGSIEETGIFEMTEEGFRAVDNPSAALLSERQVSDGSVVFATIEGNRPLLVEVQALVNRTSYGYPKRASSGIDLNRVNLLVAVLERRTKLKLSDMDIYINIVGGIRISEPAADLAVCMAIASATRGMQLKYDYVVFGEVGLSGEIRHVSFIEKRVSEAQKLGFDGTIGPSSKLSKEVSKHRVARDIKSALNQFLTKQ
ncbi:MAG TPA: DNA repair protein RadA [Candidatus Saccharimonadia bacterium]|nr:DNA repair protein RadA [Candidatus Saccharimonadia bacterium]